MARSPIVYSLPPGTTPQVPNTVIASATWNAALDDIASTFNTAQPIVYGGTGGTSVITAWDALASGGVNIASASTINLTTATGPLVDLTGTTTITTVTLGEDSVRLVRATAATPFTASASLIINGSASTNYTTTAGDLLIFTGDASSVVRLWVVGAFNGTLTSTDAGASAAPILTLYRDSATPATNDILGQLLFNGEDSAGNTQEYASIQAVIADATSASEDGTLDFYLPVAGSRTKVLSITCSAIATAAEWRTGTSTTKLLGVSETWGAGAWVNLGASLTGNLTIDFATGINFYGTATGNITFNAVSSAKEQSGEFMITASGGDRTVSFNTTPFATPNNASLGTITSATTMLFSYTRAQNGKFVISAIGTVS